MSKSVRSILALFACLAGAPFAGAQTYTWTGYTGTSGNPGFWGDPAQWFGGVTPTFGVDAVLSFGGSPTQTTTGYTTALETSYTANSLLFNIDGGTYTGAATNGIVVNAGSSPGQTLTLAASSLGVAPSIVQNGYGTVLFQQSGTVGSITISATAPVNFTGTGTGLVKITAPITGGGAGGGLNINFSPTALRPFSGGASVLLSGANDFTGNITLTNGNLALTTNVDSGTGAIAATFPLGNAANQLIINPGNNSIRFVSNTGSTGNLTNAIKIPNPVVLNSTLNLIGGDTYTGLFTGVVSGTSGITIQNYLGISSPMVNIQGPSTFTGPVIVKPFAGGSGSSATGSFGVSSSSTTTGTLTSADIRLYPAGGLLIDNTTANVVNRLNPATVVQSYRGSIGLTANATTASADAIGTVIGAGQTVVTATPTTAAGATLTIGTLVRSQFGTFDFRATGFGGTIGGANIGNFVITNNPGGQTPGSTTAGTQNLAVLPYATGSALSTASSSAPVIDLVRWDSATGKLVLLNRTTEYATPQALAAPVANGLNYRVASATGAISTAAVLLNPSTTVNGLMIDDVSTSSLIGVSIAGAGTLNLTGPLVVSAPAAGSNYIPGVLATAGVAFGTNPGYISTAGRFLGNSFTIASPITGSAGIVKSGTFGVTFANANSFTGGLTVNSGSVNFSNDSALGASGAGITLNSGNVDGLIYVNIPFFNAAIPSAVTISRPLTLGAAGGTITVGTTNAGFTYAGPITGIGNLGIGSSNPITLTNTTNNFVGDVMVGSGGLIAASDSVLGVASNRIILSGGNGVFAPPASYTSTNRDFLAPPDTIGTGGLPVSASTILTTGNDFTINGNVSTLLFTGSAFTNLPVTAFSKIGAGTLTLTASNSFDGLVTIGDTLTAQVRSQAPNASSIGGSIRLAGANGAFGSVSHFVLNTGTSLILDNTAVANSNRLSRGSLAMSGGSLTLLGNASASIAESAGTYAVQGNGSTITVSQPNSGGANLTASISFLSLQSYFISLGSTTYTDGISNSATLFVRGTNLGATTGDRAVVLFSAAGGVPVAGGIVPGLVTASSATSGPTDFASTVGVGTQVSVVPFTGYGSLTAPGAGVVADQASGVALLTGATSLNALRLGTGGGVDLGGFTLTLGTTAPTYALVSGVQTMTPGAQAGMLLSTGANAGIVNGTIDFGAQVARIITNSNLTLGSAATPLTLTGTGGLVKSGSGTLTLYGSNTTTLGFSTGTTVYEGTLVLGNARALGTGTVLTVPNTIQTIIVNAGAKVDFNDLTLNVATLQAAGTVALGNGTLNVTGGSATVISGTLTGSPSSQVNIGLPFALFPTNSGNNHQFFGDNVDFKGSVAIYNGSLRAGTPNALGTGTSPILIGDTSGTFAAALFITGTVSTFSRNVVIQAGSTGIASINTGSDAIQTLEGSIVMNKNLILTGGTGTGVLTLAGQISGPGQLQLYPGLNSSNTGASNYVLLNGSNTYTGGTFINAGSTSSSGGGVIGSVAVGADTVFGTGTLVFGSFPGLIKAENGARTVSNPIVLTQTTTSGAANIALGSTGTNDFTFTGSITPRSSLASGAMTLSINAIGTASTTYSGVISSGGLPSLGIIKNGASPVVLGGNNTYSGTTVINAGTIKLGNPNALGNLGRIATLNNNGGTTVATGSVLDLNGQQGIVEVISLGGGSLINTGSTRATIAGGGVSSLNLTAAGAVVSTAPTVSITGGGGTGATAVATLGFTNASFSIAAGSTGYEARTTFPAPTVTITGGGGTGATATALLGITAQSYTINGTGGTNYATAPTITFSTPSGGTAATGFVTINGSGNVISITITNPGSGYTSVPSPTINNTGTGGSGLSFTTVNGQFTVTGVSVTNPGTGYTSPATVTVSPNTSYGTAATGTSNGSNYSVGIQMTNNGTGYTSVPTVSITGSTATATANLAAITLTATSNVGGSGDLQIDSAIGGATFGLNKIGTGTTYLNGANTFTGVLSVLQGKLSVATVTNGGVAGSLGQATNASANLTLADATTFEYTGAAASTDRGFTLTGTPSINVTSSTLTMSGILTGTGGLNATGAGTLALTGLNTFTGPVTVSGKLSVASIPNGGAASPLGQSTSASTNLNINGGTLLYTGTTAGTDRGFNLGSLGGTVSVASGTNLTVSGAVTGSGSLFKTGFGTLTLGGTGSYSGTTNVTGGTLAVASESALGSDSVNVGPLGTFLVNASAILAKTYTLTNGTLAAASGTTATLAGATVTGGYLAGPGTFATTPAAPAVLAAMTIQPSATLAVNSSTSTLLNTTSGGTVNVAANLAAPVLLDGFYIQPAGSLTLGVTSTLNVKNFQSIGTLTITPSTDPTPTILVNAGTTPLQFGGGSRTFIGSPGTASTSTSGVDLNGKVGVVAGGLFVNNGFVYDSTGGNAQMIADYGARIKGAGYYEVLPSTVNGGVYQPGNSPTSASVRYAVIGGPNYVPATSGTFAGIGANTNTIFQINNATGTAGGGGTGATGTTVSGWSMVNIGKTTFPTAAGSLLWAATSTDKFNINLQTLTNPTVVGNDVAGPMANFDPTQNYTWTYYKLVNGSTWQGPTDSATLTASTTFTLNSDVPFANNLQGGYFTLQYDQATTSLNVVFNAAPVPEPGMILALAAGAGALGLIRRRRRQSKGANP